MIKAPFLVPMACICSECGYILSQDGSITRKPKPNVNMRCTMDGCPAKGVEVRVALIQAELVYIDPEETVT